MSRQASLAPAEASIAAARGIEGDVLVIVAACEHRRLEAHTTNTTPLRWCLDCRNYIAPARPTRRQRLKAWLRGRA